MNYVAGFLFSTCKSHVALIKKTKPSWQKGKLNAIGGKIEDGETPREAMRREFKEEAGLIVDGWTEFCQLAGFDNSGNPWKVHFFCAEGELTDLKSQTEEMVTLCGVYQLPDNIIKNLNWLVPMALEDRQDYSYQIKEVSAYE